MSSIKDDIFSRLSPVAQMPELRGRGLYAFFLREQQDLPGVTAGVHGVLYVGMTEKSLLIRNHFLHAHSGGSTLRRSLGALLHEKLKLESKRRDSNPKNADKYRFTDDSEARLAEWMEASLLAGQVEVVLDIAVKETALILELKPPLNLNKWNNPQKAFISARRKICKDIVLKSFNGGITL